MPPRAPSVRQQFSRAQLFHGRSPGFLRGLQHLQSPEVLRGFKSPAPPLDKVPRGRPPERVFHGQPPDKVLYTSQSTSSMHHQRWPPEFCAPTGRPPSRRPNYVFCFVSCPPFEEP
ncbi:hypothetical protein ATANTOWER_013561 [Ataeniobius toweri]|uniref:Uncharacterized protein n=1 Tax=Ataeniobius toweri TaxID=208326 RepID=A0ABU7B7D9_9TELE|nr:hypothetical protein [Ataeniobius toweri]